MELKSGKNQIQLVLESIQFESRSMLMIDKATGVNRANVCRYFKKLKESKRVFYLGKSICKISKRKVGFYSSNQRYNPANQLTLFND